MFHRDNDDNVCILITALFLVYVYVCVCIYLGDELKEELTHTNVRAMEAADTARAVRAELEKRYLQIYTYACYASRLSKVA